jgi:DNA-binding beta-propeller fold protein YncE
LKTAAKVNNFFYDSIGIKHSDKLFFNQKRNFCKFMKTICKIFYCLLFGLSFLIPSATAQNSLPTESSPVLAPELAGGRGWLNTDKPLSLSELKGKIVLLDFWTYGCINCIHIIPDLKQLEAKYQNELVVIGVHSAKFENEKDSENIRRIILRYELEHPVVNDADFRIWEAYDVHAYPTQVLINPAGEIALKTVGEGQLKLLDQKIGETVAEFRANGKLNETPLRFALEKDEASDSPLLFPGKVLADARTNQLFIADSNHNRIVIAKLDGTLVDIVGSGNAGLADGDFKTGGFKKPQGMAFDGAGNLYVADTGNHAIRRIDLNKKTIETIAGTGSQSYAREGGKARTTGLNSPWDLQLVGRGELFVAMAGNHQIWRMDLIKNEIAPFAGSGREARVDGLLFEAAFSQPSGLAFDGTNLYVADSEANIIRAVNLRTKRVKTVAGGDLFDFGDVDGTGDAVRLQHPLGVAVDGKKVYIADTYNHRIKLLNPVVRSVRAFVGKGERGNSDSQFYEPGGIHAAGGKLYVADTNNHAVRVVDLKTKRVSTLKINGLTERR